MPQNTLKYLKISKNIQNTLKYLKISKNTPKPQNPTFLIAIMKPNKIKSQMNPMQTSSPYS